MDIITSYGFPLINLQRVKNEDLSQRIQAKTIALEIDNDVRPWERKTATRNSYYISWLMWGPKSYSVFRVIQGWNHTALYAWHDMYLACKFSQSFSSWTRVTQQSKLPLFGDTILKDSLQVWWILSSCVWEWHTVSIRSLWWALVP